MKTSMIKTCLFLSIMLLFSCTSDVSTKVVIVTNFGVIELQLYDNTPEHSANFKKLAEEGFYDGLLFHRVIKEFLIQSGDPSTRSASSGGQVDYTIAAEIRPEYFHKRGALVAARLPDQVDPEKTSSGSQFYIVQGRKYSDYELNMVEEQIAEGNARDMLTQYLKEEEEAMVKVGQKVDTDSVNARAIRRASAWLLENPYKMDDEIREFYKSTGGAPHLDGEYTVFGEVTKGLGVVDKIAAIETDEADRPKVSARIKKVKVK